MSESDEGEMHAAMSAMKKAARTFREGGPRLLNRVRNAKGYCLVVGLVVPPALENGGKSVQNDVKTGKSG